MPYYRYQIESSLLPDAVIERIGSIIPEKKGIWKTLRDSFRAEDRPFFGEIDGYSFKLKRKRTDRRRLYFTPEIRGQVRPSPTGSSISITMSLNPLTIIVMIVWFVFFGNCALLSLAHLHIQDPGSFIETLILFLMSFGMAAYGLTEFHSEATIARELISDELDNKVGAQTSGYECPEKRVDWNSASTRSDCFCPSQSFVRQFSDTSPTTPARNAVK